MQDALTFLYDAVLGLGATYLGIGFVVELVEFWHQCAPDAVAAVPDHGVMEVDAIALPEAAAVAFHPPQTAVEAEVFTTAPSADD